MTLVLEKRLGELMCELKPTRDYSLAACANEDTNTFFSDSIQDIRQALDICNHCPLKNECLEDALKNNEYGIWGGTTKEMRHRMQAHSSSLGFRGVKTDLPDLNQAAYEIQGILSQPVSKLCQVYQVDPRTIYRWRKGIKGDCSAMELISKGIING